MALLLQQAVDFLHIVEGVVEVVVELGDDAQLLGLAVAETATDVGGMGEDGIDDALLGGRDGILAALCRDLPDGHDADMHTGNGEVGGDADTGDGDERVAQHRLHLT